MREPEEDGTYSEDSYPIGTAHGNVIDQIKKELEGSDLPDIEQMSEALIALRAKKARHSFNEHGDGSGDDPVSIEPEDFNLIEGIINDPRTLVWRSKEDSNTFGLPVIEFHRYDAKGRLFVNTAVLRPSIRRKGWRLDIETVGRTGPGQGENQLRAARSRKGNSNL